LSGEAFPLIITDFPQDSAYADSSYRITVQRLVRLLGPIPDDSLHIYIVGTQHRFDSLSGSALPDWGAGVAMPWKRRIVIKSPRIMRGEKSLGELVAHETAHIFLSRRVGRYEVPRWMNEGLAMYFSAEWGWQDNLSLSLAAVLGQLISLPEIENLNRYSGRKAQLAYSQSYVAFTYFLDRYGQSGLRIFLDAIASGKDVQYAFVAATGADEKAFEAEFAEYVHHRYNFLTLMLDSNLLWVLLALILVVGFILARFRRKKKFKELEEYDKYHSTDFDYGEVEKPDEDKPWD
jgi:hypothetical protein